MFCLFTMLSLLPASMLKANCKVIHFSPHRHHSVKEKVGRWSPCPVLQQPKKQSPVEEGNEYPRFLLEDGARRPPSYLKYALFVLSAFARPTEVCLVLLNESGKAHHSRTVASVPRPPTTKETVPSRRGNKYPRFLLEDGARRPPSYYR